MPDHSAVMVSRSHTHVHQLSDLELGLEIVAMEARVAYMNARPATRQLLPVLDGDFRDRLATLKQEMRDRSDTSGT